MTRIIMYSLLGFLWGIVLGPNVTIFFFGSLTLAGWIICGTAGIVSGIFVALSLNDLIGDLGQKDFDWRTPLTYKPYFIYHLIYIAISKIWEILVRIASEV